MKLRNMRRSDRKFELQSQLHQQYAENYNAHVTTFVTLLVAFFTMFGALGYVYAYTLDGCCGVKTVVLESSVESPVYSIQTLATLSLFVSVILCFFSYLCAMFSYIERRANVLIGIFVKSMDYITYMRIHERGGGSTICLNSIKHFSYCSWLDS